MTSCPLVIQAFCCCFVVAAVVLTTIVLPQSSCFKSAEPYDSLYFLQEMRFGFDQLFHKHEQTNSK